VYDPGPGTFPGLADSSVVGGRIRFVAAPYELPYATDGVWVLDASRQLVVPGSSTPITTRTTSSCAVGSSPHSWSRGCCAPCPSATGRDHRKKFNVRTVLGAPDCLASGITTVQDMLSLNPSNAEPYDAVMRAYSHVGIRVVLAPPADDAAMLDAVPLWRETIPSRLHGLLDPASRSWRVDMALGSLCIDEAEDQRRRGRVPGE
jgi:5-methylthioadenosine/S-adenosylhomocysteine deaminase